MLPCGRAQAIAIGQALVDGRWLDCLTHHDQLFRDEYALYRPLQVTNTYRQETVEAYSHCILLLKNWPFCNLTHAVKCIHMVSLIQQQLLNPAKMYLFVELKNADVSVSALQSTEFSETPSPDSDSVNSLEGQSEPSWFKDIKFDDSDTEQLADEYTMPSMYLTLKLTCTCSQTYIGRSIDIVAVHLVSPFLIPLSVQILPAPARGHLSVVSTQWWTVTQLLLLTSTWNKTM